jgi:DNA-binding GntR family transcriptional regulator
VKAQLDRVRVLSLEDRQWLRAILAQHEEIVERVLEGDGARAAAAMERHVRAGFASIDAISRERPAYFRGGAARAAAPSG